VPASPVLVYVTWRPPPRLRCVYFTATSALVTFVCARAAGVGDGSEVPYELCLEFPKLSPEDCAAAPSSGPVAGMVVITKQITIGSAARVAGKESSAVAFEVVIPPASASLFAVDVAKGSVAPGASQKVRVFVMVCVAMCFCRPCF
jgi:hypothetical protein